MTFPALPLRLIVGFPKGGPNDILGRIVGEWLSARLRQPVFVENRPGQSGNLATLEVARAKPDGHTLLLVGPANAISASNKKLPFDFLSDIAPVAALTREPLVMLVHPNVPARDVAEFLAHAKANADRIIMASTGEGSSPHMTGMLFQRMANLPLPVVHYAGGGPALAALAAGEAQMMFEPLSACLDLVMDGTLRALAVTVTTRCAALPNVPALCEAVPGYEASALTGIGVPKATPPEIVAALNAAVQAGFADPILSARLAKTGGTILPGAAADFGLWLAAEAARWAALATPDTNVSVPIMR